MVKLWKQWCRLCAREDPGESHINIFIKDEEESSLCETINNCFSINVTCQDDWPQTICKKCQQLVAAVTSLAQRASKVQAMFADLYNSLEDIDPEKLKVQYELQEQDDVEMDLKLFANNPRVQLVDIAKEMNDLDELGHIDEQVFNASNIKTENTDNDSIAASDEGCNEQLASAEEDDSDECDTIKQDSESDEALDKNEKKILGQQEITYNCSDCSKKYKRFPSYRLHMQTEHATKVKPLQFTCKECNKTFATAYRLKEHQSIHFPSEKLFICDGCGKAYRTRSALKAHNVTHIDERLFKCSWCDKSFKSKVSLKRHEDTHNNTKYICPKCGLQLNTQRTLQMHMVVHSDQRRHKCDYCGNEYKRAKALKSHLILHTGLKPYTCNFCEKTFASGANCRSHKKKEHPVELAAMEAAGKKIVAENVPKLEQLRATTFNKEERLAVTPISKLQSGIAHAVFGDTMWAS